MKLTFHRNCNSNSDVNTISIFADGNPLTAAQIDYLLMYLNSVSHDISEVVRIVEESVELASGLTQV